MKMKDKISRAVGTIGYDIIDNYIAPALGISGVFADLYLADFATYFDLEGEERKLAERQLRKVFKKYGLMNDKFSIGYWIEAPLALLALHIMEEGNYFDK